VKRTAVDLKKVREELETRDDAENPLRFDPKLMNYGQLQKGDDYAAFRAGVSQRIVFSTLEENERLRHQETKVFGPALFEGFKRAFGLRKEMEPFDEVEFERCISRFDQRRAERSQAMKKGSLNRAEPDFGNWLTAKAQLKMKDDLPPKAKPLQTILLHGDAYLFAMGPVGIYLLDKILADCPPNIYLHVKKTFSDLNSWSQKYAKKGGWECDITGFDANCDHNTVAGFAALMEYYSIPAPLIELFWESKSTVRTQLGVHAFATFSGEIFTYLINTFKTIARRFTKTSIPYGAAYAATGDDEVWFETYPDNPQWDQLSQYDHSEEKLFWVPVPTLASMCLTPVGAFKEPTLLYRRLLINEERGKLDDVFTGYLLEWMTIYQLGDQLVDVLTEDQQTAQQLMSNEFFNMKKVTGKGFRWPKIDQFKAEFFSDKVSVEGLNAFARDVFAGDKLAQDIQNTWDFSNITNPEIIQATSNELKSNISSVWRNTWADSDGA